MPGHFPCKVEIKSEKNIKIMTDDANNVNNV